MIRLAGTGVALHAKPVGRGRGEGPHRPRRPHRPALHPGLPRDGIRLVKPIRTERLILRNWEERDRDLFHRINSDDRVMEFFPFRRDRAAGRCDDGQDARRTSQPTATASPPSKSPRPANASASSGCTTPRSSRWFQPARSRSAGGWRRNSGARAMSPRPPRRCSISASRRLVSTRSSPSPSGTIAARPPSWSASA